MPGTISLKLIVTGHDEIVTANGQIRTDVAYVLERNRRPAAGTCRCIQHIDLVPRGPIHLVTRDKSAAHAANPSCFAFRPPPQEVSGIYVHGTQSVATRDEAISGNTK